MLWKTTKSKTVYKNPWIRVREDTIVHPSGEPGLYGVVEVPPGIFTVAVNQNEEILVIRQLRYCTKIVSWELPGGGLKQGNTPEAQAREELREEANAEVETLELLGRTQTQPGVTNEVDYFFYGTGATLLTDALQAKQRNEGIDEVRFFPKAQVVEMVRNGEISHGQSLTALLLAMQHGKI